MRRRRGARIFYIFVLFVAEFCVADEEAEFSNSWAVEVAGGFDAASEIARKHGFINKGLVGSLASIYHFVHVFSPLREKRSAEWYHPKHEILKQEERVGYVKQQVLRTRIKRDAANIFPSIPSQNWEKLWYLNRPGKHDMEVLGAWQLNYTGKGVVVSILDDGLEYSHPDLSHNYDPDASYDLNDGDPDPFPRYDPTNENKHGTRCAGEVAAKWGGRCCVGSAFNAKIGGVRMLDGTVNDLVEASALSLNPQHIDIYSSSWGPNDDGRTVDGPGELARLAFLNGTLAGRKGRGSIFVWAAGNGGRYKDSCNCDGYAISPFTISVGSASERDEQPWYLEQCSSTLVSTYSSGSYTEKQIVSTDLHSTCTDRHTGTSASAPLAAGMLALALEANPQLTWRDVQHLLVYSSNPHYPVDKNWQVNGAGLKVSHWYGFGVIDGEALINRARYWTKVPQRQNCSFNVTSFLNSSEEATAQHMLRVKIQVDNCNLAALEHVQVSTSIHILGGERKDMSIHLTSPLGTNSILLPFRPYDISNEGFLQWPFMTVQSWGETPNGIWTLRIEARGPARVELTGLELILYGTLSIPLSVQSIPSTCHAQCLRGCAREGPQYCDACRHFRIESTLECVAHCPQGTFASGGICMACSDNCMDCDHPQICKTCSQTTYLLRNSSCVSSCPLRFYSTVHNLCESCHQSCLTCQGPYQTDCIGCSKHLLLVNNTCVTHINTKCARSHYYDSASFDCQLCDDSCDSCSGPASNQCTSCVAGKRLQSDGNCVLCETGKYFDNYTMECVNCPATCTVCFDNQTCLSCQEGLFLTSDSRCLSVCIDNTTMDRSNETCIDKVGLSTCLNCSTTETRNCSFGRVEWNGLCVAECPVDYFNETNHCTKCHHSCHSCTGPLITQCLSCLPDYFLSGHACVSSCPTGTFAFGRTCVHCVDHCSKCSSPTACSLCTNNFYLRFDTQECVKECPDSYFVNIDLQTCERCLNNCKMCQSSSDCSSCLEGFVYYEPNHSCIYHCLDGYFLNVNGNCELCTSSCKTCSTNASRCTSCISGTAFHQDSKQCIGCCRHKKEVQCCDCVINNKLCLVIHPDERGTGLAGNPRMMQFTAGMLVLLLFIVLVAVVLSSAIIKQRCEERSYRYKAIPKEENLECETEIL